MKTATSLALVCFGTLLSVGCGSTPTERFETFVSENASQLGKELTYDVQKTDSEVSPFAAVLSYYVDKQGVPDPDWNSTEKVEALFAFQKDKWELKIVTHSLSDFEFVGEGTAYAREGTSENMTYLIQKAQLGISFEIYPDELGDAKYAPLKVATLRKCVDY